MERGIFPLDNICFQVFEDLIQWYSVNNVTEMRYNDDVRQFWQIGKRLFHGKFFNFTRGPCFSGQVNARETERGHFLPSNSKIDFPVPNEKHLVNTSCIPNELKPGMLEDMVKKYIDNNTTAKSYNLSGDLKKINADTSSEMGSIDLSGFEKSPSKNEIIHRREHEQGVVARATETLGALEDLGAIDIQQLANLHPTATNNLVNQLKELILIQSNHIKELRKAMISKEYTLQKLIDRASAEVHSTWKKSRYAPAISFIRSRIIEIKACNKTFLENIDQLCFEYAFFNGSSMNYVIGHTVDLNTQSNFICMNGLDHEDILRLNMGPDDVSYYLQQGVTPGKH